MQGGKGLDKGGEVAVTEGEGEKRGFVILVHEFCRTARSSNIVEGPGDFRDLEIGIWTLRAVGSGSQRDWTRIEYVKGDGLASEM